MKRSFLSLAVLVMFILLCGSWTWAVCPEDPEDLGECDSLNVICLDGTQSHPFPAGGAFIRYPILITHDVSNPSTDSIAGMQIPLCFTHTNPAAYCSVSRYWNLTSLSGAGLTRGIFRHIVLASGDTMVNWMMRQKELGDDLGENWVWANIILNLDGISHFWLVLLPTTQPLFGDGDRTLMATMTFRIQDSMHVCIDSCFWPPGSSLAYARPDGRTWVPRSNLPYCFWIGPPQIRVTSPNGGEVWKVGETRDITWISENFDGAKADVKIEYSTNSGANWLTVTGSTPNDGSYPWLIPATPSPNCRVKVSDATDGVPFDSSDADFSIVQPDFTVDATPETATVQAGQSTDYNVALDTLNGFSASCSLRVSGLPTGATANFSPNPVTPPDTSTMNVSTTGATPPGTYNLIVTATQFAKNGIQHSDTVVLVVTPGPDFTVDVEPDTQEVQAGNAVNYDVILTSLYGFASPCTLTISGLPPDASADFDPDTLTPTDTSNLQITTAETTPPDTYAVTVTAAEMTGKGIAHTDTFYLIVTPPPSFALDVSPETLLVSQGAQDSFEVTVTALYGFSGTCTLTVSGIPPDASGSFDPPTVVPTNTSKLNITVGATTPDTYTLTIVATELASPPKNGPIADTVEAILVVRGPGDFSIDVSPDTLVGTPGNDSSYKVKLTSLEGFASSCTLTLAGLPSGYGAAFDPPALVPTDSSILTISVPGTARPDTFLLTVTATEQEAKGLEHSDTVTFIVQWVPSGMEIDTVIPDTQVVTAGNSTNYQVIVVYFGGFALPCTLSVRGLPSCATGNFDPNPVGPPTDTSVLTVNTDVTCKPGTYELTILGRSTSLGTRFADSAKVILIIEEPTAVNDETDQPNVPDKFALFPNQPNPFNPETKISYFLPKACQVKLTIYNVLGQKVKTLIDGYQEAGMQSLIWNGRDDDDNLVGSGIYFYRLQADDFTQTRKMSLVK